MNNLKKPFLFLFICSSVIDISMALDGGPISGLPCINKLMPCQPYLLEPKNVPAICCIPVREIIADELGCICKVFKNADFMKSLNVTIEQVLELPKACGLKNTNASICNSASTPTTSPATATATAPPKASKNGGNQKMLSAAGSICLAVIIFFIQLAIFIMPFL